MLLQAILSRLVFGSNLAREDQLHSQRTQLMLHYQRTGLELPQT